MATRNSPQRYNESPAAARDKALRKRVSADAFSRRASLSVRVSSYAAHFGAAVCVCRLSGCVSVDFRRELVCGGAKRRRTRL